MKIKRTVAALSALIISGVTANAEMEKKEMVEKEKKEMMEDKTSGDIVAVAAGNPDFSTLVAAVKAAGLVETLQGEGPFTVLAPTNEAFAKLPAGTIEDLLKPENKEKLTKILTYHVIPGKILKVDLDPGRVETVEGSSILVETVANPAENIVVVDGAAVTSSNIEASNGVIHVIDKVLMPSE